MDLKSPKEFFQELKNLSDAQLLDFIKTWHCEGEKPPEIKAFVDYIQKQQKPLDLSLKCFDCAGTGGDRTNSFNISTCGAIIAAACGVKVTKNGGRRGTSKTGSIDVLEALGVNFTLNDSPNDRKNLEALKRCNLGFFSSKVSTELLARVKSLCRQNQITSFLNLVAPLTNPVKLSGQIVGIGQERWVPVIVETLRLLINEGKLGRALVIFSTDSEQFWMDELSTISKSTIIEISKNGIAKYTINPQDLGLSQGNFSELEGGDPKANAKIINNILSANASETQIDTVCLNAAALIYMSDYPPQLYLDQSDFLINFQNCFEKARESIESGFAKKNFENFLDKNFSERK